MYSFIVFMVIQVRVSQVGNEDDFYTLYCIFAYTYFFKIQSPLIWYTYKLIIMSAASPKYTEIGDFSAQKWTLPKMHMPTC